MRCARRTAFLALLALGPLGPSALSPFSKRMIYRPTHRPSPCKLGFQIKKSTLYNDDSPSWHTICICKLAEDTTPSFKQHGCPAFRPIEVLPLVRLSEVLPLTVCLFSSLEVFTCATQTRMDCTASLNLLARCHRRPGNWITKWSATTTKF